MAIMAVDSLNKIFGPSRKTKNTEALPPQDSTVTEKCDKKSVNSKIRKISLCFSPAFLLETESGEKHTLHILRVADILGMHLVRRGQDGAPTTCRLGFLSMVVINIICLLSIIPVLVPIFTSGSFWYKVVLLPYAVGFFLCVYIYTRVIHHRHNLLIFMEAVAAMKVPIITSVYRLVVWTYGYPLVIAVCSMVLFFSSQQLAFAPSILVVSFVPAALDVYMGSLARVLQLAFVKLTEKVESQNAWTLEDARKVMEQWFHLMELLSLYNKVRPPLCPQSSAICQTCLESHPWLETCMNYSFNNFGDVQDNIIMVPILLSNLSIQNSPLRRILLSLGVNAANT